MMSNIGAAISYYSSGRIIKKFKVLPVLTFEILSNRLINLVALLFPTVFSPLLMGSTSLAFGAASVASNDLMQKEFTQKQRATLVFYWKISKYA